MKKLLLLTVIMAVVFTLAISVTPFAVFAEETEETTPETTETPPETETETEEEEEIDYSAIINALLTANDNEEIDYDALVASLKTAMESEEKDAVSDWFTNNWGVILTAIIGLLSSVLVMFGALNIFKRKIFEGDNAIANAIIGTLENTKLKVNVEEIVEKQVKKIAVELSDSIDKVTELSNKVEPLFKSLSTVLMYVALPIAKSNKSMTTAERLEMLTSIQTLQALLNVENETLSEDLTAQIELAKGE